MRNAGFTWNAERLHAYLPAPRDDLPGVKMTYPGLKNPPSWTTSSPIRRP